MSKPDIDEIRHVADLPFGYRATFSWSKENGLEVEWNQEIQIESLRAQRKFREAYNAARRSFVKDLATCLDGKVLIVDVDGPMETVLPPSRH
jgi:hypothetical protein